jgi:hypothetical protein
MPIAATPFEQAGELAFATKCTGDPEVAPVVGELIQTPADAGSVNVADRHTMAQTFPIFITNLQQDSVFAAVSSSIWREF